MANFIIPEDPVYSNAMRRLETTDPGHADVFNPLFLQLLCNDEYIVKKIGEGISSKTLGGESLSAEATTVDENAQFPVLTKTQGAEETSLFEVEIPGLFFGTYSVVIRMKCSDHTGSEELVKLSAFYENGEKETALKAVMVTPEKFPEANRYHSFSFLVDYAGQNTGEHTLKLAASLMASDSPKTVWIDYVLVNYAYGAITLLG